MKKVQGSYQTKIQKIKIFYCIILYEKSNHRLKEIDSQISPIDDFVNRQFESEPQMCSDMEELYL